MIIGLFATRFSILLYCFILESLLFHHQIAPLESLPCRHDDLIPIKVGA